MLPNPWDAGSASVLAGLGFKALATTSSGYAWSCARADGQLSRAETLAHLRAMVAATDLPVNADFESGFADTPEGVAESVRMAVETGVAGISIEDSTGDPRSPLRGVEESIQRRRRGPRSTQPAATPCWWDVRRISSWAVPISTMPSCA